MAEVPVSTIINVQINLQTRGVTQTGFGTPMILTDEDTGWSSERTRRYNDLDSVQDDFNTSTDTYKAAAAIFSQNPKVEEIVIGNEGSRVAQVSELVFSAALITGNTVSAFTVSYAGKTESVTSTAFNTSNSQTLTDLATKIQALTGIATAVSDGTDTITITAAKAGVPFSVSAITVSGGASQATAAVSVTTPSHGVADDLSEISDQDDDWYCLIWIERDEDLVYEAAEYIQTQRKIFITCSNDANILVLAATSDLAYKLSQAAYNRTAVIYNADTSDFADAAWAGNCLTFDPGEEIWKFKELVGITPDGLTGTQRNSAETKNCNLYFTTAGRNITSQGVMASGEFIDIIRFADWVQARIEERCFALLVNRPKVPFTDEGISRFENEIRGVLQNGVESGGISESDVAADGVTIVPGYTVTVPTALSVPLNDRAQRHLTGIEFTARLAGAVHKATIEGYLSV